MKYIKSIIESMRMSPTIGRGSVVLIKGAFYGRKVDYKREDGLTGMLNTKYPDSVSIVLNNNKTPFHWETVKHTDIGTALRSLGSRLFMHDIIF